MLPVVKVYNMLNYSSDIQLDYSLTGFICIHSKFYMYKAYRLLNPVNYVKTYKNLIIGDMKSYLNIEIGYNQF